MNHQEGTFKGMGGLKLFCQSWLPDRAPRAAVILVHGMGDHSSRFDRLVLPFARDGFAAYAFDLRGFGRSPGRKGHIDAWEEYREDLRAFVDVAAKEQPQLPLFVFGYSLGSAIVLDYILKYPAGLRGAILSGLPIEPAGVASPAQIRLAKIMSRIWPEFSIKMSDDMRPVTRDVSVQQAMKTDPYHVSVVTARWGTEAMSVMEIIRGQAASIRVPVLFIHGGEDPVNLPRGVQAFYEQVTYPDKTLRIYEGNRHETHNDLDHAQVAADIAAWMAARL